MAKNIFFSFHHGNFATENASKLERSVIFILESLQKLVEVESTLIAEKINWSHGFVNILLRDLGMDLKEGKCVPHNLPEENLLWRVNVCFLLLQRQEYTPFLNHLINKRQWCKQVEETEGLTTRAGFYQRNFFLFI